MNAISLFSGAGIGEYYLKRQGIDVVAANEKNQKRADVHTLLYPSCEMVCGDILEEEIQQKIISLGREKRIQLLLITPPCQGFSMAGKNKNEEALYSDPRNYLIMSALNIVDALLPNYVLIENVPRFSKMRFLYQGNAVPLQALLKWKYQDVYEVDECVLNAADYGVPQTRFRVVYRMWKKDLSWRLPDAECEITLDQAIGGLPSLEAGEASEIKNHAARSHTKNNIECMRHTPTGRSAFENEKYYPKKADGSRIVGYGNTYKRMRWDAPAPTITMRNEIISSQENVHPGRKLSDGTWSDARVLTLRELLIVSSLPPGLDKPDCLTETAFRQLIGEGVPPLMLEKIVRGIGEK